MGLITLSGSQMHLPDIHDASRTEYTIAACQWMKDRVRGIQGKYILSWYGDDPIRYYFALYSHPQDQQIIKAFKDKIRSGDQIIFPMQQIQSMDTNSIHDFLWYIRNNQFQQRQTDRPVLTQERINSILNSPYNPLIQTYRENLSQYVSGANWKRYLLCELWYEQLRRSVAKYYDRMSHENTILIEESDYLENNKFVAATDDQAIQNIINFHMYYYILENTGEEQRDCDGWSFGRAFTALGEDSFMHIGYVTQDGKVIDNPYNPDDEYTNMYNKASVAHDYLYTLAVMLERAIPQDILQGLLIDKLDAWENSRLRTHMDLMRPEYWEEKIMHLMQWEE